MRSLAISRLCAQAWTRIPPPPWELSVRPRPSIADGLHWKLLGYRLVVLVRLVWQMGLKSPSRDRPPLDTGPVKSVVPAGKAASAPDPNASHVALGVQGMLTPFASTVRAAPS